MGEEEVVCKDSPPKVYFNLHTRLKTLTIANTNLFCRFSFFFFCNSKFRESYHKTKPQNLSRNRFFFLNFNKILPKCIHNKTIFTGLRNQTK